MIRSYHKNRWLLIVLCFVLAAVFLLQIPAYAQGSGRTVRVGWHEAPYFITDQSGRRSGYTYDYQQKIAAFTGWEYEYITGSWSDLLRMIKNGEIDLLGNVSFMEERAKDMQYASLPMGTEAYYLFIAPNNHDITAEDYSSLDGKRVGVAKDSMQSDLFRKWAETHGAHPVILEQTGQEDESLLLLGSELDAFVTMDNNGDPDTAVPVWKIGSSDFFFAVSKDRSDLLAELNAAMNSIQDENKYFNQQLNEKYLRNSETSLYLSDTEREWLLDHGTIRVGYQDNYLAFCATDPVTGKLTGALKDYLDYASTALVNAHLNFEAVAFPTAAAAIEALKNGQVDCVFPANLSYYDSESLGVVMTPPLMGTEMDAVVRSSEKKEFVIKKQVIVAVNEGNTNYDLFLSEHFPDWQIKYFPDTPTGLEAVAKGDADCVIISNYRFSNISKQCEKLHLSTVYTGVDMDYYFAVNRGDTALYSILSKITRDVPDATVHTALTYYSTEDVKSSFTDLIKDNLFIVMTVIAVILVLILFLLLRSIRAERMAIEEERQIRDLNKKVFVDALTSVRNKGAFTDYTRELQMLADQDPEFEFAIGVFDCDDLKSVNDQHGHDKGDLYLKSASTLICRVFQHSPVFRIGGDEFTVVLMNDDFKNRENFVRQFEEEEREISSAAENSWEQVHIAYGIAVYDPEIDRSVDDTARRADKIMYENKRESKSGR